MIDMEPNERLYKKEPCMSLIFSLKNISKTYGDDTLFQDLSFDFKLN